MPGKPPINNSGQQQGYAIGQSLGNQNYTAGGIGQIITGITGGLVNLQNNAGNNTQLPLASLFSGTGTSLKMVVYWGVAALALVALAGPYPDLATGFTVLLIIGVLLTHYQEYIGLFSPPAK